MTRETPPEGYRRMELHTPTRPEDENVSQMDAAMKSIVCDAGFVDLDPDDFHLGDVRWEGDELIAEVLLPDAVFWEGKSPKELKERQQSDE